MMAGILDFGHCAYGRLRNAFGKANANSAGFGFWIKIHHAYIVSEEGGFE
jgi:hypothetical protein